MAECFVRSLQRNTIFAKKARGFIKCRQVTLRKHLDPDFLEIITLEARGLERLIHVGMSRWLEQLNIESTVSGNSGLLHH
jgi:hypothetical protein